MLALVTDKGESSLVREPAIEVLSNRSTLPDKILKALVVRLEDKDERFKNNIVRTLCGQSKLPDKVLGAMAKVCEDSAGLAVEMITECGEFRPVLLNRLFSESIYRRMVLRSFEEHWSWHIEDDMFCINMPHGFMKERLSDMQELRGKIYKARGFAQSQWGYPQETDRIQGYGKGARTYLRRVKK